MEMEYFVPPKEADEWFNYWLDERFRWYLGLGIREDELRLRHHERDELSRCGVAVLPLSKARELERASSTYECTDSDVSTSMYCLSLISRATSIRLRESLSAVVAESE
jgi:hypothetical protein